LLRCASAGAGLRQRRVDKFVLVDIIQVVHSVVDFTIVIVVVEVKVSDITKKARFAG
jgi:hypothetical protein